MDYRVVISQNIKPFNVFYGCETWSLTLKEHRLTVFVARPNRIYGYKMEEVTRGFRILHHEELRNLFSFT
jgi:hypothetical protein